VRNAAGGRGALAPLLKSVRPPRTGRYVSAGCAPLHGTARPGGAGRRRAVLAPSAEGRRANMAAEIHSRPQSSRPVLLSKVEGHQDVVSAALLIPKEDGVITASEDR